MIVTQKVTTLAFQLHDGNADLDAFSTFTIYIVEILLKKKADIIFIFQACVKIPKN